MAFGQPSFGGIYGGLANGSGAGAGQANATGGPDYEITSPMAGGTGGDAPTTANVDAAKYGLLGEPLSWWFVIIVVLVGISLLGGNRT